jgi:xanthine dehydrogenase accessory factor
MRVLIERLSTTSYEGLARAIRAEVPVGEVTVVAGPTNLGAKLLIWQDGSKQGSLGLGPLDATVEDAAVHALRVSHSHTGRYALDAGVLGRDATDEVPMVEVFFESHVPAPTLIIVGAGHVSIPLASMAGTIGFSVVVIDARSAYATRERFPGATEVLVAWPHEALADRPIGPSTYLAVLTHDPKFEEPLLPLLLRSSAQYIGVIGSRRTQSARLERLRALGFGKHDLQRLSGPIGLDIGAVTPEEIALSILAEIVATRHGKPGGYLSAMRADSRL